MAITLIVTIKTSFLIIFVIILMNEKNFDLINKVIQKFSALFQILLLLSFLFSKFLSYKTF